MTIGFRTAVVTGVVALAMASPLSAERLPVRTFTTADGLPRDQLQCVLPAHASPLSGRFSGSRSCPVPASGARSNPRGSFC